METKLGTPVERQPALHAPSRSDRGGGHQAPPRSSFLAALLCLMLCAPVFAGTEYAYCYIGTTGLTKTDFTFLYENTDTKASVATTSVTVTEDPAGSKWYYFGALEDPTSNYRFAASYGGDILCDYVYPLGGTAVQMTWQNSFTYTVNSNVFKQGDISPTVQLTVPGFASDCTGVGWTAKFNMWNSRTNAVKVDDAAATVSCTLSGTTYTLVFSYTLTSTNTNMSDCLSAETNCQYLAEFGLYNPAGAQVQTFPPNDSMAVRIVRKR